MIVRKKSKLYCAICTALTILGQPATAQEAASIEEVVVTGSRLRTNGFGTPTPVTVLNSDELRNTNPNIVDALRDLPQLQYNRSTQTFAGNFDETRSPGGQSLSDSIANIRDIGSSRSLTLVDGRRAMVNGATGLTDQRLIPQALVQRVELITGGASAAYGSDAVAGVVNFILDREYEGVKFDLRTGISGDSDGDSYGGGFTFGSSTFDGRGHFLFSLEFEEQSPIEAADRDFYSKNWVETVNNPGPYPNDFVPNGSSLLATNAGGRVWTSLPMVNDEVVYFGSRGNAEALNQNRLPSELRYKMWDPQNGLVRDYDRGIRTLPNGSRASFAHQLGGDGGGYLPQLRGETEQQNVFVYADYEINSETKAFAEFGYARAASLSTGLNPAFNAASTTSAAIRPDNAFLIDAANANPNSDTAVLLNYMQTNNRAAQIRRLSPDVGAYDAYSENEVLSLTLGLEGTLANGLLWDASYSYGEADERREGRGDILHQRIRSATEAVYADGTIVCRDLAARAAGCIPWNIMKFSTPTDQQSAFFGGNAWQDAHTEQQVFNANLSTDELFSTWAGAVPATIGYEWRDLSTSAVNDPNSSVDNWWRSTMDSGSGSYDVTEIFAEAQFPLLRDQRFAQALDFNSAIRNTEYSHAGNVTTWKFGFSWQIMDELRVRATKSRDIRAPNLGEGIDGSSFTSSVVTNYWLEPVDGEADNIEVNRGAALNLVPEDAETFTAGFVYQPDWLPGLGISFDYYEVEIDGAIALVTAAESVDQCYAEYLIQNNINGSACSQVTFSNPNDPNGLFELQEVSTGWENSQALFLKGRDVELNYATDIGSGLFTFRALAVFNDEYTTTTSNGLTTELTGFGPRPDWQANLTLNYSMGNWSFNALNRYIPETTAGNFSGLVRVENVKPSPDYWVTNATVRYNLDDFFGSNANIFLSVRNLFDKEPPIQDTQCFSGPCFVFTHQQYDRLGRYFNIGMRVEL